MLDHDRIAALLDLYLVFDQSDYRRLLRLAHDAWHAPLPQAAGPALVDLLWVEQRAERIRCNGTTLVPDLLQTAAYAEAVIRRNQVVEFGHRRHRRDRDEVAAAEPADLTSTPLFSCAPSLPGMQKKLSNE